MENFVGLLIRRERLEKDYSQEGLCRGICAVSYLSKIEQGKAQARDDVVVPLLARLGIDFETDPEFLARGGALVASLYEKLLTGREEDCRRAAGTGSQRKRLESWIPWTVQAMTYTSGTAAGARRSGADWNRRSRKEKAISAKRTGRHSPG